MAGSAPAGWRRVHVSELVSIAHGYAFKGEFFSFQGEDALATPGNFLEQGGFRHGASKQRYYTADYPASYRLFAGDLIVAMTEQAAGLLGSAAHVPATGSWLHNQRVGRVNTKSADVSLDYLYFVFNTSEFRRAVFETSAGTKVRHTSPTKLGAVEILLPELLEQERIVAVLRDMDAVIETLDRSITKKQSIKQGMMQQLLTGRTRLPEFNGQWSSHAIGEFARVTAGGTPSTQIPRYWGGNIPWMSSGELHQKRVHDVRGRIASDGLRESSAQLLPAESVLIGLAGQGKTRGTVAISKLKLSTNQSIAGILPSSAHDPRFLYYNLDTRYDELRGESTGDGGRGGLNLTIIKKLRVYMPDVAEQSAISDVLSHVDDEIDSLARRLAKADNTKQGMMQELLTGRTRLPSLETAL